MITRLIVGGAQENTLLSCALIDQSRFETLIVAGPQTGAEGELHSEAQRLGIRTVIVRSLVRQVSPLRDIAALVALWRVLEHERPDVVHTHSSKAGVLGRIAARLAHVPVIVHTAHGWVFHDYMHWPLRAFYTAVERWLAETTDSLIVVAHRDRDKGLQARVGTPGQYVMIRSGFDLRPYREGQSDRARLRATLGIPGDAPIVGTVGRLSRQKDPLTFVKAAASVVRQQSRVHFVIVGDGPLRTSVEQLAEQLGIARHVHVTGIRRDVPDLLRSFDIFVLPSLWEGLPKVLPQAMAVGLPVITTGANGASEAVEHDINGILIPPADPDAIAREVLSLLADPGRADRLGRLARASVAEFDVFLMVRKLEALYDELYRRIPNGRRDAARCTSAF